MPSFERPHVARMDLLLSLAAHRVAVPFWRHSDESRRRPCCVSGLSTHYGNWPSSSDLEFIVCYTLAVIQMQTCTDVGNPRQRWRQVAGHRSGITCAATNGHCCSQCLVHRECLRNLGQELQQRVDAGHLAQSVLSHPPGHVSLESHSRRCELPRSRILR